MAIGTPIRWQQMLLVILAGLPLIVLVFGWGIGIDGLKRLGPGQPAMTPSASIGFLLLGAALLIDSMLSGTPASMRAPRAARILLAAGLIVAALATANIVLLSLNIAHGLDGLLMPELERREAISIAAAFAQLLAASCCLLLSLGAREGLPDRLFVLIASLGLALATIALIGHLLDAEVLHTSFVFSAMSLRSSVFILSLFVALMMARPDGWIWLLLGEGRGSAGARRLFPAVVLGPPILFTLVVVAREAGVFTASFRASLLALALIALGLVAILRNARIENRAEAALRQALHDLEAALEDKEMLLREVYHRVKNNMQATDALLAIESTKFRDPEVLASFRAMSSRVQALAMVHQMLIRTARPSRISTVAFLSELCTSIDEGNGLDARHIRLVQDVEDDDLDLDAAILVGLLINELVANAIKHAFPHGEPGSVLVRYRRAAEVGARRWFMVRDDGVGTPKDAESETTVQLGTKPGIGSRLIRGMVVQLKGEMTVENEDGMAVTILFPAGAEQEKTS